MTSRFELTRNITIGQYIPTGSVIHQFEASLKLLSFAILVVGIAICSSYTGNLILLAFSIALFGIARIPIHYGISGIKPALPFMIILSLMQLLFYGQAAQGETTLFQFGFILITTSSVQLVIVSAMRFIEIILVSSVLTLSTSTTEMTHGLEHLLKPLKYIKFPVYEFSLIITIAIRFVPTFAMEMEKLMKAQASRGAEFGTGKWWQIVRKTKDTFPLIIPLFSSAMERAEDLILAMESRCYTPGLKRTSYRQYKIALRDFLLLIITTLFSIFIVFYKFTY
ncbi:energy-coupling factor transporter transmembrane protein EcfT [Sporolactobacillus sp. THM7-4]|nr:energy-coupling factor transporter transmembrane protein EcfT [Sporolactobacillus sp. THM7-4]